MEIRLNASEMSNLWATYNSNTATVCLIRVYLQHVEDEDIKRFLEQALHNSEKSVMGAKHLLEKINYPIPIGFSESDLNLKASRLFSDKFFLLDIWRLSEYGMIILGMALNTSQNREVRDFYTELLILNINLFNEASDLTPKKGVHVFAPPLPIPENIEFLDKETLFQGFFGDRRTLNALEIKEIVFNLVGLSHGIGLLMGFSQVAQLNDVREHLFRGKEICSKQVNVLQSMLKEEDLPTIPTFESEVTESSEPPFSDKLMMFLTVLLTQLAVSRYGISLTQCSRSDITVNLTRLTAELAKYLKDGTDIMLEKRWLEQPPMAIKREALIKQ
jgi:hypothetical protein